MLSKCANPACSTSFHYLRDGKLFQMEFGQPGEVSAVGQKKPSHRVEYFWLCTPCSEQMTLKFDREKGIYTVPLVPPLKAAAGF